MVPLMNRSAAVDRALACQLQHTIQGSYYFTPELFLGPPSLRQSIAPPHNYQGNPRERPQVRAEGRQRTMRSFSRSPPLQSSHTR